MTAFPVRNSSPAAARRALREHMAAPEVLVLPGAFDATSAIMLMQLGFKALWAGGYLGSTSRLGAGDLALMSMGEQMRFAESLADATGLPVVADCDDGFGGPLQVCRTVQAFERAGVAALQIEDQAAPKHCAFYEDFPLRLISKAEMVAKLRTALDVRLDAATMVWARCDALAAGLGVRETLDRIRAYADAGVDAIFVPCSKLEDLAAYAREWDRPQPLVMSGTAFLDVTLTEVAAMGFSAKVDPFAPLLAALQAVDDVMSNYRRTGCLTYAGQHGKTFKEFEVLLGTEVAAAIDVRYIGHGKGS